MRSCDRDVMIAMVRRVVEQEELSGNCGLFTGDDLGEVVTDHILRSASQATNDPPGTGLKSNLGGLPIGGSVVITARKRRCRLLSVSRK